MKKIFALLFVSTFIFTACEGPQGPPGFDGEDGVNIVGETYEFSNVNFASSNDYVFEATFNPSLYEGDVMLAYRLESVYNGLDVWEPLPTVSYYNNDTGDNLLYRYNYTINDINIIVESSNFAAFGAEYLNNQVFRVVIVPSDLVSKVDTNNINEVMQAANIKSIQTLN
ncbi:hypothetical protein [Joostella sp. CR20]|uniref:hypothetical protein n=1 Tax=Joostella sp. CR20 TaxID=2804312 RepID=UPI00313D6380